MDPRCIPLYEEDLKIINSQILTMKILQCLGVVIGLPIIAFGIFEYLHGKSTLSFNDYYKPISGIFFSTSGFLSLPRVYKLKREGAMKGVFIDYYRTYCDCDEETKSGMRKECEKLIEVRIKALGKNE